MKDKIIEEFRKQFVWKKLKTISDSVYSDVYLKELEQFILKAIDKAVEGEREHIIKEIENLKGDFIYTNVFRAFINQLKKS